MAEVSKQKNWAGENHWYFQTERVCVDDKLLFFFS